MLQSGHHSALLGRFPPPILSKNLDPVPFCPPPPIMEVLVDPPPNEKKSYFHPSETFKLLLLECQCGLTIVRRNTH